jgi:hypothetical protein
MVTSMNNRLVFVVFLPIFTFAAGAHAQQRPLVTEDPETIGPGRVLIEGGVEFDFDQTNSVYGLEGDITHFATLGVSVGIGPSAEVQVDGGFLQRIDVTRRIPAGPLASRTLLLPGDSVSSLEDFVVATKIRFGSETESRPALGLRFGAKLPMADPENGIGLGTTDFFTSLLIAKTVQSVRTVGNAGLILLGNPADGQDTATALGLGLSVARAITNEFEMVVEMNGRLTPFDEIVPVGLESRGVFRLAGRYTYSMLRLDFGVLVGTTNRDPSFGISAGATYVITR